MLGRIVDESLTALPRQMRGVWGDTLPLLCGGMAQPGEEQVTSGNLETSVTAAEDKVGSCLLALNSELHCLRPATSHLSSTPPAAG